MSRIEALWDAGVNIAFGQDCVMDLWYAFGTEDISRLAWRLQAMGVAESENLLSEIESLPESAD